MGRNVTRDFQERSKRVKKPIPVLNRKPEFSKYHTEVISSTLIQPFLLWSLPPTLLTNSERSTAMRNTEGELGLTQGTPVLKF